MRVSAFAQRPEENTDMSTRPLQNVLSPEIAAGYRLAFDEIRGELTALQERRRQIGADMRRHGCSYREMAFVLQISRSYSRDIVTDPQGTARRARTRIVEKRRGAK